MTRTIKIRLFILGSLAVCVALLWYAVFFVEAHRNLEVHFFDVGQGDAILVQVPNGNTILIDGGPSNAILAKLGHALPFWSRTIDLMILTHPHADHLDGLVEVVRRYRVRRVLDSGVLYSTPEFQEWRELLKQNNVEAIIARRGEIINAGSGVWLDVLTPFEDYEGRSVKNPHDANIVMRLAYASTTILFMGDAEKPIEYRLISETPNALRSDILKVGHHGSKTSSTEDFLRAVSPRLAIISVGRKNRYGHPTQEVLGRLQAPGIKVFRTDLDGDIAIESNGKDFLRE